ncbi:beta-galactosidase [Paenarthrobacter nitroguajacolicus]|uniref:beta-galactosidase n=1 Tax=Paenarthrobacter nitroguajacolicus TaxID=211146 RepID=UPI003AE294ED
MQLRSHGLKNVTDGTGLLFGADYNPEQWPEQTWPEDIALMKRAGVNIVTVGVFSWARLQPEEGQWNFGWLDRLLDLLADNGIRVCLATPTASPPPWLGHHYPDSLPTTPDGTTLWYGSRNQFSPSSSAYRAAALAVTSRLASRYAGHPAVAMWHVGNELGQISYDDETAVAFRSWLLRRYGSLDAVNTAWGTAFWSQGYSSWEEILPPRTAPYMHNPTQVLDFHRFTSEALLELFMAERDVIRSRAEQPVTTNLMGFFRGADYFRFAKETDFIGNNHYVDPAQPQSWETAALTHDLCRGLAGGAPWMLMESATSAVSWRGHNVAKDPGALRVDSLSAIARGSDAVCYFQFRQSAFGAERFHSAMVPLAGADTRVFREVCSLGADLQELRLLAGTPAPSRIAVLFDWDSWWASESPDRPSNRLGVMDQLLAYYRPLLRRGHCVEVIHPSSPLGRFDLVLAPSLFLLGEKDAEALGAWVSAGGTAVVGPFSGVADANGHLRSGRHPAVLADMLGVTGEEWRPLANPVRVAFAHEPLEAEALSWSEDLRIHTASASPVASFASGPLSGQPAVVRNNYGKGWSWYAGADLPQSAVAVIIEGALRDARLTSAVAGELPSDVELAQRGDYLFLLNHGDGSRRVELNEHLKAGGPSLDLLSGTTHEAELTLPPYGVLVLKNSHTTEDPTSQQQNGN